MWTSLYETARAAWPGVPLDAACFERHVRQRLPEGASEAAAASLHTRDLYLACACLHGSPAALAAFEQTYGKAIAGIVARFHIAAPDHLDLLQQLRFNLFVKKSIARYSGKGQLRGWLRSTTMRAALDLRDARTTPEQVPDAEAILRTIPAAGDVELDLARLRFAAEFKAAFTATLADLSAEDRQLLAQHHIDGLSIDALAVTLGIHRSNTARRIARLHAALAEGTRARLRRKLVVGAEGLESLMELAQGALHVSVFRLLRDSGAT